MRSANFSYGSIATCNVYFNQGELTLCLRGTKTLAQNTGSSCKTEARPGAGNDGGLYGNVFDAQDAIAIQNHPHALVELFGLGVEGGVLRNEVQVVDFVGMDFLQLPIIQ